MKEHVSGMGCMTFDHPVLKYDSKSLYMSKYWPHREHCASGNTVKMMVCLSF